MSQLASAYEWFADDEVDELTRLLAAIRKWKTVAQDEFESHLEAHERDGSIPDELYDQFEGEAFSLADTERAMYGTLAVAIASSTEGFVDRVCQSKNLTHTTKKCKQIDRPNWGHKQTTLERHLGIRFQDLPGCAGDQRARILGNCFKHSCGRTSKEYVEVCGGGVGNPIEYEKEDWGQMIEDIRTFLVALSTLL